MNRERVIKTKDEGHIHNLRQLPWQSDLLKFPLFLTQLALDFTQRWTKAASQFEPATVNLPAWNAICVWQISSAFASKLDLKWRANKRVLQYGASRQIHDMELKHTRATHLGQEKKISIFTRSMQNTSKKVEPNSINKHVYSVNSQLQ